MKKKFFSWREITLIIFFLIVFVMILCRLFYWQVFASEKLAAIAKSQYHSLKEISASRGEVFASDNFPLVTNKKAYLLYAILPQLKKTKGEIAQNLASLLPIEEKESTKSAKKKEEVILTEKKNSLLEILSLKDLDWVTLEHKVSEEVKAKIDSL